MRTKRTIFAVVFLLVLGIGLPLAGRTQEKPKPNPAVQSQAQAKSAAEKPADKNHNIIMNFRGASLDTVLDYLSQAAGFIIVKQTNVDGQIDVWSYQPLTQEEAVDLLNTVLHEKGYAAIRNGRTLSIVKQEDAKHKDIPVKAGNDPDSIPKTDEMVTQIIPVRYADVSQIIQNLQPLLPTYATMTANESSNAIIITDVQTNIRRMMEIIRALDTSIASISSIRVFNLSYSSATDLATMITSLFQDNQSSSNNRNRNSSGMFFGRFGGRGGGGMGGPGGMMGGPGGGPGGMPGGDTQSSQDSDAKRAASRVVAVGDDNTNSLIVIAPDEIMPLIETVVEQVDKPVSDVSEIRVFNLEHADATEIADQLEQLFPDTSSTSSRNQFAPMFGRGGMGGPPGMGGFGGGQSTGSSQQAANDRQLMQTTVRTVPDPRTNSIIVLAPHETMEQIAQMVQRLDSDSSKKQKVYVYRLEHADVDNIAEILRNIFENDTTSNRDRTTDQNSNTLSNRQVSDTNSFTQSSRSSSQ